VSLSLARIAAITGGSLLNRSEGPPCEITGVSIDSRSVATGDLFVAVRGERHDGHDFLGEAARRGAGAALVSRTEHAPETLPLLCVENTLRAFHLLAGHARAAVTAPIIGITGSTGKTTTKEFVATLMESRGSVLRTEGNLNNQFGVPLTLLRLKSQHVAGVVEMGMSSAGELRLLTRMVQPDVAVITNVAPVHLEFFASLEAIARAKAEILEGLRPVGCAVLNHDDPHVRRIGEMFDGEIVWFGAEGGGDISVALRDESMSWVTFEMAIGRQRATITLNAPGRHTMMNFAAAASVAYRLGVSFSDIVQQASRLRPVAHRGELRRLGQDVLLVDDAAVSILENERRRRRVVFLGEMLELGPRSRALHEEVGERIAASMNVLIGIGPLAQGFLEGARRAGLDASHLHHFVDSAAAAAESARIVRSGDLVLIKGSRGVRTEKVVDALIAHLGLVED
jgi:UDP-N-acetylmuramoyl-tripeptide--D-alanyl-D-alanine ligase